MAGRKRREPNAPPTEAYDSPKEKHARPRQLARAIAVLFHWKVVISVRPADYAKMSESRERFCGEVARVKSTAAASSDYDQFSTRTARFRLPRARARVRAFACLTSTRVFSLAWRRNVEKTPFPLAFASLRRSVLGMENLQKKITDALRANYKAPPFDEDRYVKDWLSQSWWRDGEELLYRAALTKNWAEQRRTVAFKMFVDLIMSAECSLKSIIVTCSPDSETPEDAYNAARDKSHKLEALGAEAVSCHPRAKPEIDFKLLQEAAKIGVHTRYSVEVLQLLATETTEEKFFSEGTYSRVLNEDWLQRFVVAVQKLSALALRLRSEKLPLASLRQGDETAKAGKRLKAFKQSVFKQTHPTPAKQPQRLAHGKP